jgi:hypothetical protein
MFVVFLKGAMYVQGVAATHPPHPHQSQGQQVQGHQIQVLSSNDQVTSMSQIVTTPQQQQKQQTITSTSGTSIPLYCGMCRSYGCQCYYSNPAAAAAQTQYHTASSPGATS